MCYNDNVPAGALHDKRAPWNQEEPRTTICSHCLECLVEIDGIEVHERTGREECPEDETTEI